MKGQKGGLQLGKRIYDFKMSTNLWIQWDQKRVRVGNAFPSQFQSDCFQLNVDVSNYKKSFGPETGWIDQMRNNTQYDIKTVVTTSGDQEL